MEFILQKTLTGILGVAVVLMVMLSLSMKVFLPIFKLVFLMIVTLLLINDKKQVFIHGP